MTVDMRCQDKERLIAYLYGEDDAAEREAVETHLGLCGDCAGEIEGLRAARGRLAEWRAPEVDLGFRVVREPARTGWRVPAWAALPAAAALVLAAGAAIANLEVRYGGDGLTVRSGWQRSVPAAAPAPEGAATVPAAPDAPWREALAETERRLRAEFSAASSAEAAAARPPAGARDTAASGSRLDPAQVRALIEASERRQQRELALRIAEVVQDMEAQRRADLVQIDENLGQIEGLTAARQREVMNYLVRVAEGR